MTGKDGLRPRPRGGPRPDRLLVRTGCASAAVAALACLFMAPAGRPVARPSDAGALPTSGAAAGPARAASPPLALTVPGHVERVPVDPVTVGTGGVLAVPDSPSRLGWWALGAHPGAARGTLLLAGHLDTADEGAGPLEELHAVPLGARVQVTTADGARHTYRIVARRTYPKSELPADLFSADGAPRLALVTCAGTFDRTVHAYADNLVLYGVAENGMWR
ncbi:class F sortase [Streptomyces sp. NPDC093595]|uniref:class F sortase n=1 Tax=Streptomyces sp. NPDC093595 TaxID=3366045 RepID=UPI00381E06EF